MSTTATRDNNTDKYIVLTQYDSSSNNLETSIVQALVQSAYNKTTINIDPATREYTSPVNNSIWDCADLSANYVNTSAISNYPSGTLTEYSVISSVLSHDISFNSYSTSISDPSCGNNTYSFTTLTTSAAFYDANFVVTQNLIADCSDNQGGIFVTGTFDVDSSNANIQYAMQSRWNTILGPYTDLSNDVGPDPTSIQQDFSNNVAISFAYKGTGATDASYQSYWYNVDASDGSLLSYVIDASFQPVNNRFLVADRDLSGVTFTSADVGIFRIQQTDNIIETLVSLNDGSANVITQSDLNNMPLFDGYGTLAYDSSKNSLLLPGWLSNLHFDTLFNDAVKNTIANDWTFTIDISSNDGGYFISDGSQNLMQDLNNDNLLDNPFYMANYVSNEHRINFSNSYVTIDPSTNGVAIDASSISVDLTNGETLDASYAGVNGQFIINTNTIDRRWTDLSSVNLSGSYYPQVAYQSDAAVDVTAARAAAYAAASAAGPFGANIIANAIVNAYNSGADQSAAAAAAAAAYAAAYAAAAGLIPAQANVYSTAAAQAFYAVVAAAPFTISITNEEMINHYFAGMWQKVAQNTLYTDSNYWISQSNNAIMTLYNAGNGIVNNAYEAADFDFSFNNTMYVNDPTIRLWKITGSNTIITNPQSLYANSSYTNVETGFSTAGVITGLTDDLSYNNYRFLLTAKTKEDLSLYKAVTDVSGWELNYTDSSAVYLTSDSNAAYSSNAIPSKNVNNGIMQYLENVSSIPYSYTYYTVEDASSGIGGLVDYVDISYNYGGNQQLITISQTDITRTYNSNFNDVSFSIVPDASYSFTGPFYNKTGWDLVYVTAKSRYDATFLANFGPFDNIELKVKDINQTDNFYAVRNKNSSHFAPHTALNYVTSSIPNFSYFDEVISALPGNSLQIIGTLNSDDIKGFNYILQGTDNNDNWENLSGENNMDTYYGLVNNNTILSSSATTSVMVDYSAPNSSLSILSLQNYYIPFVYDQTNNSFTLESFSASDLTISTRTTIGSVSFLYNTSYLTLANGYNTTKEESWQNSGYTLNVDSSGGSTTFLVTDASDLVVFSITALNYTVFLGTYYVSYIPQDYYRVERQLGNSALDFSYNESFLNTDYANTSVSLAPTLQGLYLNDAMSNMDLGNNPILGGYQSFRVLGDYMKINLVGDTVSPTSANELGISTYNDGSLSFQYVDPSNASIYSAELTFPKYRGYKSYNTTNPNEYYTIVRASTVVTFDVSGGLLDPLRDTLTSNMYYQESFVVDDLRDTTTNNLCANLGVTSLFNYSIPPTNSILTYLIDVSGDSVNVSINNPKYQGDASNILVDPSATPVVNPKSYNDSMKLTDYGRDDVYTFSGNYYDTENLMSIRPSRVKLHNSAYPYDTFSYILKNLGAQVPVYKAKNVDPSSVTFNWIGDPALKGQQDPDIQINPNDSPDWEFIQYYGPDEIYWDPSNGTGGIPIGKKLVYQNPNFGAGHRIAYVVSTPPYYKFEQISTDSCPQIPYDYDSSYAENRTTRYMPFIDTTSGDLRSVFNPFAPNVSYVDICGNTIYVSSNSAILNNVTFTLYSPPVTMTAASSTITYDTRRYGIIVPGTNLTISEYVGLYDASNSGSHSNPIWTGPVTSIPSTPNINNNALIFRRRDDFGGIYFSALQYPADIGYLSGTSGYQSVFKTDASSNWYNIDFYIGNSAWFNKNNPITYFDVNSHGIKPTLYTVEDISQQNGIQINKRRVYKYSSAYNVDIDISNSTLSGYQTFNLTFDSRSYYDFDISMNNNFGPIGIWKYNDLLHNTIISNNPVMWISDDNYSGNSYVSWAFGNSTTAKNMLIDLFSVQNDQNKWTYIHLIPFMRYVNQFNLQVGSIAWDGSVTAPLVNTRVVSLASPINNPALENNTYAIQEYSESTL